MQFGAPPPTGRLISLAPLIDVVFILLVFFMLASSFLDWRSVELKISSGAGAAKSTQRAVLVSLKADGSMALGAQPVTEQALRSAMAAKLAEGPDRRVVIRSEAGVSLQRAVDILDLLRAAGAANVSLSRTR